MKIEVKRPFNFFYIAKEISKFLSCSTFQKMVQNLTMRHIMWNTQGFKIH